MPFQKGHKSYLTEESKRKIGVAVKERNKGQWITKNCITCSINFLCTKGRERGYCTKKCAYDSPLRSIEIRNRMMGFLNPNWKGGVTPINIGVRMTAEYRAWRESVFQRDNYTCVLCFQKGGVLNADHIKTFAHNPTLRFSLDNGRTLCIDCHRKTENYGSRANQKALAELERAAATL